jgi:hypothetical protein
MRVLIRNRHSGMDCRNLEDRDVKANVSLPRRLIKCQFPRVVTHHVEGHHIHSAGYAAHEHQ